MQVVPLMLSRELVLLDRLAAMALVVATPPAVTGAYTGWAYERVLAPVHEEYMVRLILPWHVPHACTLWTQWCCSDAFLMSP